MKTMKKLPFLLKMIIEININSQMFLIQKIKSENNAIGYFYRIQLWKIN
jgi:hypothetical protein